MEELRFQITDEMEDERIDKCMSLLVENLSRSFIQKLIKDGNVLVNGMPVKGSCRVKCDDEVVFSVPESVEPDIEPENIPLDILYEDEYLIAINKPSGLLSIGNDKERDVTAYRMVSDYVKKEDRKFIFVVHRIDQDTSGVLLFCKDQRIRDKMQENWNTIVKKRGYIALVEGIHTDSGTYHSFLKENRQQFVYSTRNNTGKEAITHYKLIKKNKNYSLMQVFIDTGRRNQIRVHFSEHGYPLVGDKKYGAKSNPIKRLCLHANILEFVHPVSKKIIHIESEAPKEFLELVR